jgi:hypothetical protein
MRSSLNQRTKSRQDEISTNYDYHLYAHNACLQEKLIESMRDQHARDMQAWQDRLQRELQAQDEVCSVAVTSSCRPLTFLQAHKLSLMGYLPSQVGF